VTVVPSSLYRKIFGETRTIPLGVGATLAAGTIANSLLPVAQWRAGGGFALAAMLIATIILSLPIHPRRRRTSNAPRRLSLTQTTRIDQ
jgi:hypothetical protein